MKVKTSDLIGPALDWAVAKCEILPKDLLFEVDGKPFVRRKYLGEIIILRCEFSTNWAQGGPIIERERINIKHWVCEEYEWEAFCDGKLCKGVSMLGPTPLIAAMRCYVASRLGAEVEIPDEFKQEKAK